MSTSQTAGYETLGADVNKVDTNGNQAETQQGVVSPKLPELALDMADADIASLTKKWQKEWDESPAKSRWQEMGDENEKYWVGDHYQKVGTAKNRPNVDNLMFESLETYLPQVTRRNPEPVVTLAAGQNKDDEGAQGYVIKVKDKLNDLADDNVIRLKLKRAARHWAVRLLGVAKMGWDLDRDIPVVRIIRAQKIILDPTATVDEDGYSGGRIGEIRKMDAGKLMAIVEKDGSASPDTASWLKEKVGTQMGTEMQFIEWWTPTYMCWTMEDKVLRKIKNPHWNYDSTSDSVAVDDYGNETPTQEEVVGVNHLPVPTMPYEFLVVYNLGDQPMDRTSLMGQNLANQDRINKRNKQIDENADNMNGGLVVSISRSGLTESQAKNAASALRKGGIIAIPDGNPQEAIYRPATPGMPADVYNDLVDTRERMRDIFGTRGSSAAGIQSESTVRGKILSRTMDTDRIGGGVSEYLEQFADRIYNQMYQMLLVYDADFIVVGGGQVPKVRISVKEGSLLPKDSTTIANQAIDLATAGKMSTLDMYKRLEYPNPEELAANVWLEANAPEILFKDDPRIAEALQMQAQAAAEEAAATAVKGQEEHQRGMERDVNREVAKQGAGVPPTDPLAEVPVDSGIPSG